MPFTFTRRTFANHGPTPVPFLEDIFSWAKSAPDEIFAPNEEEYDAFGLLRPASGWQSLLHRKATLLDAGIVHAGYESDWNWHEGVDKTNATSMENKRGQETGPWQVSFDSENLHHEAMLPFAQAHGIANVDAFIFAMKNDKHLSCEYYFRLLRISTRWAGPWNKGWIEGHISPEAVAEWQTLLSA